MKRKTRILTLLAALAGLGAVAGQPNIVFFIADDVSQEDFGCYGHATIKTPHTDALAASGMRFDNAYLTTSSCSPSRCSIITGRYPHNTGAPELHTRLPDTQVRFPELLRKAGYHQFTNLADNPEYAEALAQARLMIKNWTAQTGDTIPENPKPDRHAPPRIEDGKIITKGSGKKRNPHAEMPGAASNATQINHPGPVHLQK